MLDYVNSAIESWQLLIQDKIIVLSSGDYYKVTQYNVRAGDMPT